MTIKTITAIAVAATIMGLSTAAEAGGKGKRHGFHKGHHIEFSFGRHYDPYWESDYGYYKCRRYFRKAKRTGKRFWWRKYERCLHYYR